MEFGLYLCVQGHKEHLTNYEYDHVANLPAYLRQVVCLPRSVNLESWLYTLPDRVRSAATISEWSWRNPKAVENPNLSMIVVPHADTRSTGHYFQGMAQSAIDKSIRSKAGRVKPLKRSSAGRTFKRKSAG